MIGAAFYGRFSCEKQNAQSIEGQLRVCQQYAAANGITILETYIDEATTGTNDQRPAFQKMLADSAKPVPWSIVLVYAIDRFGRNSIEIAVNKQKLKKNNKTLISATQRTSDNIDGSKNLDGILLENVYIGIAEYYSAELSQKVSRGMYENRRKGYFCGGLVPYGYRVENKKILVDENQAEVVRYIFEQYASGRIAKDIIDELTAKGIFLRGKPFPINTFYNLLRAEKYIGIYRHGDEVYDNFYPPIVPKALFDEVQVIVEKNKRGSRSPKVDFLLRDKLFCGYCGKTIHGDSGTSKSGKVMYYYKCRGRKFSLGCNKSILPKEKFEQLIINATLMTIANPAFVSAVADGVMKVHEKRMCDKSIMNMLLDERQRIKKALENVMKAIEEGIITPMTKSRMDELERQRAEIEDKITIEECKAKNQITREQVIQYLTQMVKKSPRQMIYSLINKVIAFDDRIEIYYNYIDNNPSPSPDENEEYRLIECSDLPKSCSPIGTQQNPQKGSAGFFFCTFLGFLRVFHIQRAIA